MIYTFIPFIVTSYYRIKSAIPWFCVEGLPKILDFGYFVFIWWQTDKKQEILKQSCKDLFIWTEPPIIWLIIRSDNIPKIEVNRALVKHVIVHNLLMQNRNWLIFWILDPYVNIISWYVFSHPNTGNFLKTGISAEIAVVPVEVAIDILPILQHFKA